MHYMNLPWLLQLTMQVKEARTVGYMVFEIDSKPFYA